MISDSGANDWEEGASLFYQYYTCTITVLSLDILPMMRSDKAQFLEEGSDLSVQDSIIIASLGSIAGKGSERAKQLFRSSAVWGEGMIILHSYRTITILP